MKDAYQSHMETLSQGVSKLKEDGYTADLEVTSDGLLKDVNTGETYSPDDVKISSLNRYEGQSNPSDMSILYGISMSNGKKGLLIDSYGAVNSEVISEFIMKVNKPS